MHITASVFINDDERGLHADYEDWLEELAAQEFIRRFLQNVLPKAFVKVRYYGFLSSGCRKQLAALRQHLGSLTTDPQPTSDVDDSHAQTANRVLCPSCGQVMQRRSTIHPGDIVPREHYSP